MDSHHEQVMKARAAATGPARLYFAYSTILDRAAFDEWRLQHEYSDFRLPPGRLAEALDVKVVFDFPSRFWGGRVAGLADHKGGSVFGMLFEISALDWPIVQHKEGAITHMCMEREVRIRIASESGKTEELRAVAFVTRPERQSLDGPVSTRFVEALVRGAVSAGLPAAYVDALRQ